MPKIKKNPIIGILEYFRTAELAQAEIALALAKEEVSKRQGPRAPKKTKPTKPVPAVVGQVGQIGSGPVGGSISHG